MQYLPVRTKVRIAIVVRTTRAVHASYFYKKLAKQAKTNKVVLLRALGN
jgi:hypothetical protein